MQLRRLDEVDYSIMVFRNGVIAILAAGFLNPYIYGGDFLTGLGWYLITAFMLSFAWLGFIFLLVTLEMARSSFEDGNREALQYVKELSELRKREAQDVK